MPILVISFPAAASTLPRLVGTPLLYPAFVRGGGGGGCSESRKVGKVCSPQVKPLRILPLELAVGHGTGYFTGYYPRQKW